MRSIPQAGMNGARKRQLCTHFVFPNYFHGEFSQFSIAHETPGWLEFPASFFGKTKPLQEMCSYLEERKYQIQAVLHVLDAKHQTKQLSFSKI